MPTNLNAFTLTVRSTPDPPYPAAQFRVASTFDVQWATVARADQQEQVVPLCCAILEAAVTRPGFSAAPAGHPGDG